MFDHILIVVCILFSSCHILIIKPFSRLLRSLVFYPCRLAMDLIRQILHSRIVTYPLSWIRVILTFLTNRIPGNAVADIEACRNDNKIREKDKEILKKDNEIIEKDKEINKKANEIIEKDKEINKKDIEINELKKSIEMRDQRIQEYAQKRTQMKKEIERLTNLLSKQMQQKLSEDESSLENINCKNRPSKIVDDFNEAMTTVWLDAKESLDQVHPDETQEEVKVKFLCEVLMKSYQLVDEQLRLYRARIQKHLFYPFSSLDVVSQTNNTDETGVGMESRLKQLKKDREDFDKERLGSDLHAALVSYIKQQSDSIDLSVLLELLWKSMDSSPLLSNLKERTILETYMSSALRLAWRMAVQKPPLVFITPDMEQPVCKDRQEIYFSCPKHPDNVISSYVYPIIAQKDHFLTKGRVFVVPRSELNSSQPEQLRETPITTCDDAGFHDSNDDVA